MIHLKSSSHLLRAVFFFALTSVVTGATGQEIDLAEPYTLTRIYSDTQGESHFSKKRILFQLADFAPPAPPISVSDPIDTKTFVILSSPSGWYGDWHPTPNRQYIFIISGMLEVEVSDGESRIFKPGQTILVEDTTGVGHRSRVVSKERVYCIAITLGSSED
jgi:mannose-6-phosphate isomerase-like protein (cupin superfamily)